MLCYLVQRDWRQPDSILVKIITLGITSLLHMEISVNTMTPSVALFTLRDLLPFSTLLTCYFGTRMAITVTSVKTPAIPKKTKL